MFDFVKKTDLYLEKSYQKDSEEKHERIHIS